jgi:DNA processing protein
MPPILFAKGILRSDDVGVSIVGSRGASPKGRSMAANIATGLFERGLSVISGLADGIDTAAHQATLEAGGRPVGVIGTGINRVYPSTASSRALHERVAGGGVLISQFLPDAPPSRTSFPMRNVTMSGLGRASIIVEAGERSGTRVLARAAVEHGRAVILTDAVVNATDWGKQLVGRPGVYVAGSTSEVMSIVESIVAEDVRLDIAFPSSAVTVRLPDTR